MNQVNVDFTKVTGSMHAMHSVNNGPFGGSVRGGSGNDADFREAGIPFARNHDASYSMCYGGEYTVDVNRIFRNFDADENDPANYDFMMTDRYMTRTYACGTKMFYRLGSRIEHEPRKWGTVPPADFAKWARICEHIIRHYTEGWGDGFTFDVPYWEIWNEPDCLNPDGKSPTWQGSPEQFAEFYEVVAVHLKKCFPNLKIGGPAMCWLSDDNRICKTIMDIFKEKHPPMDFFSFHCYTNEPDWVGHIVQVARQLCEDCGYPNEELILNEWNYVIGWVDDLWKKSMQVEVSLQGASFVAAVMLVCQDAGLDHLMYYDAQPGIMNGMFNEDATRRKGYYPFWMFNKLYQLGSQVSCTYDNDIYANAAIGESGAAIMLTHYKDVESAEAKTVKININGQAAPLGYKIAYYLLDEEHDGELVREEFFNSNKGALMLKVPLFATYLVQITPATEEDFQ